MEIQGLRHTKKQRLRGDRKCPTKIDKLSGTPSLFVPITKTSQGIELDQYFQMLPLKKGRNTQIHFKLQDPS